MDAADKRPLLAETYSQDRAFIITESPLLDLAHREAQSSQCEMSPAQAAYLLRNHTVPRLEKFIVAPNIVD